MPVLDFLRRHPLWVGSALGAVIGTIIGLFLPIRVADTKPARDARWDLPTLAATRSYTEASAAGARGATYWGEQSKTNARAAQKLQWTLKAIVSRPIPRIAVAHGSRNEISWVGLGGALPDGAVLVALDRDTAWVERDGCRSPRPLYSSSLDPAADPCAPANVTPSPRTNPQKTNTQ